MAFIFAFERDIFHLSTEQKKKSPTYFEQAPLAVGWSESCDVRSEVPIKMAFQGIQALTHIACLLPTHTERRKVAACSPPFSSRH